MKQTQESLFKEKKIDNPYTGQEGFAFWAFYEIEKPKYWVVKKLREKFDLTIRESEEVFDSVVDKEDVWERASKVAKSRGYKSSNSETRRHSCINNFYLDKQFKNKVGK